MSCTTNCVLPTTNRCPDRSEDCCRCTPSTKIGLRAVSAWTTSTCPLPSRMRACSLERTGSQGIARSQPGSRPIRYVCPPSRARFRLCCGSGPSAISCHMPSLLVLLTVERLTSCEKPPNVVPAATIRDNGSELRAQGTVSAGRLALIAGPCSGLFRGRIDRKLVGCGPAAAPGCLRESRNRLAGAGDRPYNHVVHSLILSSWNEPSSRA